LEKNASFFLQKLAKIAESCHHNIDPRPLTSEGWSPSPLCFDVINVARKEVESAAAACQLQSSFLHFCTQPANHKRHKNWFFATPTVKAAKRHGEICSNRSLFERDSQQLSDKTIFPLKMRKGILTRKTF
jgi:hypothetical protein